MYSCGANAHTYAHMYVCLRDRQVSQRKCISLMCWKTFGNSQFDIQFYCMLTSKSFRSQRKICYNESKQL